MAMFIMITLIVPWTLFYYEQDSDVSVYGKVINSAAWVLGAFTVIALILGLCYGFIGFVDFPVQTLTSGMACHGVPFSIVIFPRPGRRMQRVCTVALIHYVQSVMLS